ncbi:unnamed protein product [Blepharisma stoltei]|uniref:Uncharacterized protein n=1 Tax=Blepharisma stoltei TaxID=1481888 RepID=A0AAU9JSR8_9CILI|nr:unnamed protein product [Blepharisma stoltei]
MKSCTLNPAKLAQPKRIYISLNFTKFDTPKPKNKPIKHSFDSEPTDRYDTDFPHNSTVINPFSENNSITPKKADQSPYKNIRYIHKRNFSKCDNFEPKNATPNNSHKRHSSTGTNENMETPLLKSNLKRLSMSFRLDKESFSAEVKRFSRVSSKLK